MEISTIGLDLAKSVFQVYAVDAEGKAVIRKALRRAQVLPFFAKLPACLVGIEACGTEAPRVCRKLQLLSKWSLHEQDEEQIFA